MKRSRWLLLVVALAVIGVVLVKEATRTAPTEQREVTAQAPAREEVPDAPAPANPGFGEEGAPSSGEPDSPDRQPPRPAAATAAPQQKPEGPLPGSKLDECLRSGRPTLADFGMGWCKPCQEMEPILKQAARDYWGKANIVFVELQDYPQLSRQYRIAVMPTQVFFDAQGREVTRSMGSMSRDEIDRHLSALGVKP